MSSSEKIAIAAHLHVLMRRKTGRVTDTEWMATDPHYAHEIARLAREKSLEDGHADLAVWADKLEDAMAIADPKAASPLNKRLSDAVKAHNARALNASALIFADSRRTDATGESSFGNSQTDVDATHYPSAPRYIKGLR